MTQGEPREAGVHEGQILAGKYDLRASMVTIGLANGRSEEWIRRRTGHTSSALERYHPGRLGPPRRRYPQACFRCRRESGCKRGCSCGKTDSRSTENISDST
jgi:hypothetical protein